MMGLNIPKLYAKFQAPSFRLCKNNKGEPQIFGAPLARGHAHVFLCVWFYYGMHQDDAEYQIWSS